MEEKKITLEQLKKAVLEDLKSANPENTMFKVCMKWRDSEDREDLDMYFDYNQHWEDTLYKRFTPDIEDFIKSESRVIKDWYLRGNEGIDEKWRNYREKEYSEENVSKKFYFEVIKYVESEGKMTMLYSAFVSLDGEVVGVDDPTWFYRGLGQDGYTLSENEKLISDYTKNYLWNIDESSKRFKIGDILFIDGSPFRSPFYAVYCGVENHRKNYLYIKNAKYIEKVKNYGIYESSRLFKYIVLDYENELSPFYKIEVVEKCPYKSLMRASEILKEAPEKNRKLRDLNEELYEILNNELNEYKEEAQEPFYNGNKNVKEITRKIECLSEKIPDLSFMDILSKFSNWLLLNGKPEFWELDDDEFLELFSEYKNKKLSNSEEKDEIKCSNSVEQQLVIFKTLYF